eukprot:gene17165-23481_t
MGDLRYFCPMASKLIALANIFPLLAKSQTHVHLASYWARPVTLSALHGVPENFLHPNGIQPIRSFASSGEPPRSILKKFRLTPSLESQLHKLQERFEKLSLTLSGDNEPADHEDSHNSSSGRSMRSMLREYNKLQGVAQHFQQFLQVRAELEEVSSMCRSDREPDAAMRALAEEEKEALSLQVQELESGLLVMLLPQINGAILEVRAGAGGDEAALFASRLMTMYQQYAESKGWQFEPLESMTTEFGGIKFGSAAVSASGEGNPSHRLRFESGVHRVQRVPVTDNMGRIHTSTATVAVLEDVDEFGTAVIEAMGQVHTSTATAAVLADVDEVELHISDKDLRIDAHRSTGAGGQHVNVTNSACRVTHLPTAMIVTCQQERSFMKNRDQALRVQRARLKASMYQVIPGHSYVLAINKRVHPALHALRVMGARLKASPLQIIPG